MQLACSVGCAPRGPPHASVTTRFQQSHFSYNRICGRLHLLHAMRNNPSAASSAECKFNSLHFSVKHRTTFKQLNVLFRNKGGRCTRFGVTVSSRCLQNYNCVCKILQKNSWLHNVQFPLAENLIKYIIKCSICKGNFQILSSVSMWGKKVRLSNFSHNGVFIIETSEQKKRNEKIQSVEKLRFISQSKAEQKQ